MSGPPTRRSAFGRPHAALWRGLSRLRGARIVHPDGVAYRGTLTVEPDGAPLGAPLFDEAGTHSAVVRFSRSIGVPAPLPDLLGMTVRIEDAHGPGAHQDFPMITSASGAVLQHLLLPGVAGFFGQPYSTSLPYAIGGRTWVVGAVPHAARGGRGQRGRTEELEAARRRDALRFSLTCAPLRGGRRVVGSLRFGERLSDREADALAFNPWNSGGGIRPTGPFMGARLTAYRGSQEGRQGGSR